MKDISFLSDDDERLLTLTLLIIDYLFAKYPQLNDILCQDKGGAV